MNAISTVIPAYNAGAFLSEAIESVFRQTVPSEIVVVDDGSTDNTYEILQGFGDSVRVIQQPNLGLSAARNTGIKAASAEFIALLDADDVWLPHKLQKQLDLFRMQPELELVHTRTEGWSADTDARQAFVDVDQSLYQQDCFARLFLQNAICVSSVMFRRKTVMDIGNFDEQIVRPTTQDHDLWLRLACRYEVGFVDELSVLYRRHDANASGDIVGMLEDRAYVLEKTIAYASEKLHRELDQRRLWEGLALTCYLAGYQHFHQGNFGKSKLWLRKAFRLGYRNLRSFCGSILPTPILRLVHQHVA